MHLKKEHQYSLYFIMFAFLSLAWEVCIYILNPQWILWKRKKKKRLKLVCTVYGINKIIIILF